MNWIMELTMSKNGVRSKECIILILNISKKINVFDFDQNLNNFHQTKSNFKYKILYIVCL